MKKLFTVLATVLLTVCVYLPGRQVIAQAPDKMSYQAVVRNASDVLIQNSSIGIQISILQGSTSGAVVYSETHISTSNINGLVTIEIGGGTPVTGTFTAIDWSSGPYFLKTETDPTGGANYTISGTSQLLSVPFALHAKSSGTSASADNVKQELQGLENYLYSQLPEPVNPIAKWKFEGNLNDNTVTYNLTSSGSTYETGKIGSAFKFTGSEECYNTDVSLRRIFDSNNSWSVNLWFNSSIPYDTPTGFGDPSKLLFACDGENISPYKRTWILADQRGILFYRMLGSGNGGYLQAYFNFVPDTWYHVSINFNGTTATVYINSSEASFVLMGDLGQDIGNVDANTTQVTIGGNRQNNCAQWKGLIDEVSVYSRVLTSAEVYRLYYEREFPKEEVVTDISGNKYNTVKIGTQTWMTENLSTTKYRNGDLIGTTTPSTLDITGESNPMYQWVYDGEGGDKFSKYGRLYTWFAATDSRNVCPVGWHVPSDAEWTTLENYLIANGYNFDGTSSGNKIAKSLASSDGWNSSTTTGAVGNTDYSAKRNATGFTALPSGDRNGNGTFDYIGSYGYWWSATEDEDDATNAWFRLIYYDDSSVWRHSNKKQYGFSVRCLRD